MKLFDRKNIERYLALERSAGKIIGLCHGCFDLVHVGHLEHFRAAKNNCDLLVVSLTKDEYISKGPGRPMFTEDERVNFLLSIREVDAVFIAEGETALDAIEVVQPNYYFKGIDYKEIGSDLTGNLKLEVELVKKLGGKLFITETEKFSSTDIIKNKKLLKINIEVDTYLSDVRKKITVEEVFDCIDNKLSALRMAVCGDIIIDEYVYTTPVGTTSKSPTISCVYNDREVMFGGSMAIAKHLCEFVNEVELFSMQGGLGDSLPENLENNKPENLKINCVEIRGAYTPRKIRFFGSGYPNAINHQKSSHGNIQPIKLFELAYLNDVEVKNSSYSERIKAACKDGSKYDGVVVADFGHGFVTAEVWAGLQKLSNKIFCNVQTNSTNYGFNLANKLKGANLMCIDELEARLLLSDRASNLVDMWSDLINILNCEQLVVTRGRMGMLIGDSFGVKSQIPAMATNIIDPVGAGDAVLAAMSMCRAAALPEKISEIIAISFGALACQIVGNREPVKKAKLKKFIEGWL